MQTSVLSNDFAKIFFKEGLHVTTLRKFFFKERLIRNDLAKISNQKICESYVKFLSTIIRCNIIENDRNSKYVIVINHSLVV